MKIHAPVPFTSLRDGNALLGLAVAHGLAPMLYHRLKQRGLLSGLPCSLIATLGAAYARTAAKNQLLLTNLCNDVLLLNQHGIEVIVLKGSHLAHFVYADPALRPMQDIDILVRPEDCDAAERLLIKTHLGASRPPESRDAKHHHLPEIADPRGVHIEIHRHLHRSDRDLHLDIEQIWNRSRTASAEGRSFRVLSPEDLLVHLAIHAAGNHRFEQPLRWILDISTVIHRFSAEMNWDLLARISRDAGAERHVYLSLRMCRHIAGARVPEEAMKALEPAEFRAAHDAQLCRTCLESGPRVLPERGRAARAIVPPRSLVERQYGLMPGSSLVFPLYVWRPLHLLVRRGARWVHDFFNRAAGNYPREQLFPLLRWLAVEPI